MTGHWREVSVLCRYWRERACLCADACRCTHGQDLNPEDLLNKEVAEMLQSNPRQST